jgi:hypothetical protein
MTSRGTVAPQAQTPVCSQLCSKRSNLAELPRTREVARPSLNRTFATTGTTPDIPGVSLNSRSTGLLFGGDVEVGLPKDLYGRVR